MINNILTKNKKFLMYIAFSIAISGVNILVYFLVYNFMYSNILFANAVAYLVSFIIQFVVSRRIIFKSGKEQITRKIIMFVLMKAFAMLLDSAVLYLLQDCLGINKIISKIISNSSTAISNYWLSNNWVFRDGKELTNKK